MNDNRGNGVVDNQDLEETKHPQRTNQRASHTQDGSRKQRQTELQQAQQHQPTYTGITTSSTQDNMTITQEQHTQTPMTIHSTRIANEHLSGSIPC
jgi:hypothetical protein